jgi:hypothetical protein
LPDSSNLLKSNFVGAQGSGYASGTYDPATGRAYFSVYKGKNLSGESLPVIEVYQIAAGTSSDPDTTSPQAPTGVQIQIIP